MIEVIDLVKRYGDRNVVDHLNFTVEKGQIVGFLGPNGAGKSTTMNIITGYISATEGTVLVDGHDIFEEPEEAKACIGYLPEQPPVYPDMRVREYLQFVAELKKVFRPEIPAAVGKVMRETKISDVSERLIKHLSKGYRQRVGLAGALLGDPEILILDEPTVGLDPKQIIEIRELIIALSKQHTILLSSHIMQEVNAVCNQILIINQGKLVAKDTPENIPQLIKQTNQLTMQVKGTKEKIKKALNRVDHIETSRVTGVTGGEQSGLCKVEIVSQKEFDLRETIFYTFAKEELPILEMSQVVPTLEEVFLSLTGEGTKQYGGKMSKQERKQMREQLRKQMFSVTDDQPEGVPEKESSDEPEKTATDVSAEEPSNEPVEEPAESSEENGKEAEQ